MSASTMTVGSIIPRDFDLWRIERSVRPGGEAWIARRTGRTLHLVRDGSWWRLTMLHRGRVLGEVQTTQLPERATRVLATHGRSSR